MTNAKRLNEAEKIRIQVDPEIQDLIPGFIENRKKDIVTIREALGRNDYAVIRTLGHGMKGAGAGYGFEGITDIGKCLEEAALEGNRIEVEKQVLILSTYMDRLEIICE